MGEGPFTEAEGTTLPSYPRILMLVRTLEIILSTLPHFHFTYENTKVGTEKPHRESVTEVGTIPGHLSITGPLQS